MARVRDALRARRGLTRVWVVLGALAMAVVLAVPAFGYFSSSPSKECAHKDWNGEYWKAEIDEYNGSFKIEKIETSSNVAKTDVSLSIAKDKNATWSLSSDADFALFRIYEKGGKYSQVNSGLWFPGQGGQFSVEKSISHVTFCFKDIPAPQLVIDKKTNGGDPSGSNPNFVPVDGTVTWVYEVRNPGNVPLKDVAVVDSDPAVSPAPFSGDDGDGLLEPGEKWVYKATGTAIEGTWDGAFVGYSNTGTVTAVSKFDGSAIEASDTSGYYGARPAIDLEVFGPTAPVLVGSEFVWSFRVTNTGNVPLAAVIVTENDVVIGNCTLGVIDPGADAECTLTEIATIGQESSTFVAKGIFDDGTTQTVISETIAGVSYEINEPPVAGDDEYETPERTAEGPATLMINAADGVLANDSDPDGDPLTAGNATTPTNGGSVSLNANGSFDYMPSDTYPWGEDEFSRVDTFDYTVADGKGGTDVGTVQITVNRVICIDESVSAEDGDVVGVFTLLDTQNDPCKAYGVDATEGATRPDDLITLEIPGADNLSLFRGLLTFSPQTLTDDGELILGVRYDPDLSDGIQFRTLPVCIDPEFDEEGLIVNATLPHPETGDTWCFGGALSVASTVDGEVETTSQVIGLEDPGFSAR